MKRAHAIVLGLSAAAAAGALAHPAHAEFGAAAEFKMAFDDDGRQQTRFRLEPTYEGSFWGDVQTEIGLRFETAPGPTGLGAVSGYSGISKPLVRGEDVRLEIDKANVRFEVGETTFFVGKQTIAWGALDGVRVNDAFNPARLNEFVVIDDRPDRIPLWAARARGQIGGLTYDAAVAPDPTVNQFAEAGDTFFPVAPRFRGGAPADAPIPELRRTSRNDLIEDAVIAGRLATTWDGTDFSVSVTSGPDPDAVLRPVEGGGAIELRHPRRTLIGAEVVRAVGPTLARIELAASPGQTFNAGSLAQGLREDDGTRILAGVGVDWNAPQDVFVTFQAVVDHVAGAPDDLVRPDTDVIGTFRAQRDFVDGDIQARFEALLSASDGDGVVRPAVHYRVNDFVTAKAGADMFFGDDDGVFGQFKSATRGWLELSAAF